MAHTITIANTKGGSGKSTIAVNLAVEGVRCSRRVLLIDADTQGSAVQFITIRDEDAASPQVVQITQPIIHKQIAELGDPFDLVVIDTGGRDSPTFRSALLAADVIVAPIAPSAFDTWASDALFTILDEVSVSKELDVFILYNQVRNTIMTRDALRQLQTYFAEHDARPLETYIYQRTAWERAVGEGMIVSEWEPHGAAAKELRHLAEELGVVS